MVGTRPITSVMKPGTVGSRTHSRKRAAQRRGREPHNGEDGTFRDMVLGCQAGTRLVGGRSGTVGGGGAPAPVVCRGVTRVCVCVPRCDACVEAGTRRRERQHDGGARCHSKAERRRDPTPAPQWASRRQVPTSTDGWQPRRGDRALGKEDRTGSPARPSSLLEGGCHGTTRREVP